MRSVNKKLIFKPLTAAVICALSTTPVFADVFKSTLVDENGSPIKNAKIHVHGQENYVTTDSKGNFVINAQPSDKLHIGADKYEDKEIIASTLSSGSKVVLNYSDIEHIIVNSSGLHQTTLEMATPVSVLAGDELKMRVQPTLGETIKAEPGVHSTYYSPVASSPVIRGMSGPRVKVLQNGLDASDVSNTGPDHANAVEGITTKQIEILRGPATLLYGSGAIGGVVNVIDNRIPTEIIDGNEVVTDARYSSVSNEKLFAVAGDFAFGDIQIHADAFSRKSDEIEIPKNDNPHHEEEDHDEHEGHDDHDEHEENEYTGKLANSDIDAKGFNLGASYITNDYFFGLSFGQLENDYGIPGHHHHHEEEEDHDHEDEDHDDDHDEHDHAEENERVYAALRQDRVQFAGAIYSPFKGIETLSFRGGYTDYEHTEFEAGVAGTSFTNKTTEARITAEHEEVSNAHGIFGYHYTRSKYSATGEEAFTPASTTTSQALFLLEEMNIDNLNLQFGTRIEQVEIDANQLTNEHVEGPAPAFLNFDELNFSASLGFVWTYTDGYSIAASFAHAERSPSAAELLSNGLHIATNSYDLGAMYQMDEHGDIEYNESFAKQETASNIDVSWRKYSGDFRFTVSGFYNRVDNYFFQRDTGFYFEHLDHDHDEHDDHGVHNVALDDDDHDHDHEAEGETPIRAFTASDVQISGIEAEMLYTLSDSWSTRVVADYTRVKLVDGGYLPRIPPMKFINEWTYAVNDWQVTGSVHHYAKQDNVTANEEPTDSYTLLNFEAQYFLTVSENDLVIYLQGQNLTDEYAQVHSSFLKEQAPLPGRNFSLGVRGYF